jgi:hypothetical protein
MPTTAPSATTATGAPHDRLGAAIALAERGFAVFPLRPGSKVPAVREDWEGVAVADPDRLRELGWPPQANIGIACGPSGLFVLDLDVPKQQPGTTRADAAEDGSPAADRGPRDGAQALRELAAGRPIPRTFTVATPSGGTHLYFLAAKGMPLRNTVARLGPLIDTRARGGYVVAPGSEIGGTPYKVVVDAPVAPVPRWIVRELAARARAAAASLPSLALNRADVAGARVPEAAAAAYGAAALRNEVDRMRNARVGTRNDTLNRAAYALGRLIGAGLLDRDLAASELFHAARQAGLPARECASTLASGLGAGIARPRLPARRRPESRGATVRTIAVGPEPNGERRGPSDASSIVVQPAATLTTGKSARTRNDLRLFEALRAVDQAYDAVAVNAASLVFSQDWRRIRALMDALRDLRDAPRLGPAQRRHAAQLCEAVGEIAAALERTVQGPARRAPGRRRARSPLSTALRDLRLAASRASEAVTARASTRPESRKAAA